MSGLKEIVKRTWRNRTSSKPLPQRDSNAPLAPKEGSAGNSPDYSDPEAAALRANSNTASGYTSFNEHSPSAQNTGSNVRPFSCQYVGAVY